MTDKQLSPTPPRTEMTEQHIADAIAAQATSAGIVNDRPARTAIDYRALCAELANAYERELNKRGMGCGLITRTRIALAQPETQGPTDKEIRRLWDEISAKAKAKMVQEFMDYGDISAAAATAANVGSAGCYDVEKFARAVLARWGRPTPQPPADGEVAELVAWLRATGKLLHPDYSKSRIPYMRAADLLQRLASDNAGLTVAADSLWADNVSLLDEHQ